MNDEKYNDYFDGDDTDDTPAPETPEQVQEREIAADTIEVKPNCYKRILLWIVALFVLFVFAWAWLRYFHPSVSIAQRTGRVMEVKCEGTVFKTFEGEMISEEYVADTTRVYQRDFAFSVVNDSVARALMSVQAKGKKITLTYKEYQGTLPWRGSSRRMVTAFKVD